MKSANQEECVLCCKEINIYATGACDHPVCYECSARMRVLCETNECPICRSEMPRVVFTVQPRLFSDISRQFSFFNVKYQIVFETEEIKKAFESLLLNICQKCEEEFPTFAKLTEHVRRKHELHYCDVCTDNLKIFTFERRCYSRKDLARHKIKGDPDLTSHRGHPLCEFCSTRYMDYDELYRHVRREHFFCHFCDADGINTAYEDYNFLRVHFRKQHYLCEEGDCAKEQFTGAFRNEIDLKSHKATVHCKNMSRAEARQARTLQFDFNYPPHLPTNSSSPRGRRFGSVQVRRSNEEQSSKNRNTTKNQPETEPLDTQSTQEFPYLSEDALGSTSGGKPPADATLSLQSFGRNAILPPRRSNMMSAEDFPALGSGSAPGTYDVPSNHDRKVDFSSTMQDSALKPIPVFKKPHPVSSNLKDLKSECNPSGKSSQKVTPKWLSKRDNSNFEEDFPKLEAKRTLAATPTPVETKANSVPNYATSFQTPHSLTNDNQQSSGDHFVVIKSKSKKKKQKAPVLQDEEEVDDDDIDSNWKISNIDISRNIYSNLNNQENKDPIMRHMPAKMRTHNDPWETKVSFGRDDFPPLEVKSKPPPGLNVKKSKTPSPGFTANSNFTPNSSSSLSMSSIARIVEKSLKSNIDTETMNGIHSSSQIDYKFQEPPNFELRNNKLIKKIDSVSGSSENLQEFKSVSRSFRVNKISATDYYRTCLEILGDEGFLGIFPDLISLLPDIPKQQELLAVHNRHLNKHNSNAKQANLKSQNNIQSCKSCNQVLLFEDYESHNCVS